MNNKVKKGSGGPKHLLNRTDECILIRWECIGADMTRILCEFEESINETDILRNHNRHEYIISFQEQFYEDVKKFYYGMSNNPFTYDEITVINRPFCSLPDEVFDNLTKLEKTIEMPFKEFMNDRLIFQKIPVNEKITKNMFYFLSN